MKIPLAIADVLPSANSSKKKSRTQEKRERRAAHGKCGCKDCLLARDILKDPLRTYILRHTTLSGAEDDAVWGKRGESPAHREFLRLVQTTLELEPGPAFDSMRAVADGEPSQYVPGYVLLCCTDSGVEVGMDAPITRILPLSVAQHDFVDGGVAALQELTRDANADPSQERYQFDLALWITGFFDSETPLHVLAVDAKGNSTGALMLGDFSNWVSTPFIVDSMPILQAKQAQIQEKTFTHVGTYCGEIAHLRSTPGTHFSSYLALSRTWGEVSPGDCPAQGSGQDRCRDRQAAAARRDREVPGRGRHPPASSCCRHQRTARRRTQSRRCSDERSQRVPASFNRARARSRAAARQRCSCCP